MSNTVDNKVRRYSGNERVNHWFTAIAFILLAMSGLAFFHPAFWPMVAVLGGGELARYLHPIIGVAMFASFLIFAIQKLGDNLFSKVDGQWLSQIGDVLSNRDERLPEIGKYNAGQKLAYWAMVLSMVALLGFGPRDLERILLAPIHNRPDPHCGSRSCPLGHRAHHDHHRSHLCGDLGQGDDWGHGLRLRLESLGQAPSRPLV